MHTIKIKTLIVSVLILCSWNAVAFSNNEEEQQLPTEIKINKPIIISTSHYDINGDGKKEVVEIILKKGNKIVKDVLWCGGGERWEGDFIVQVRKGKKVLSYRL